MTRSDVPAGSICCCPTLHRIKNANVARVPPASTDVTLSCLASAVTKKFPRAWAGKCLIHTQVPKTGRTSQRLNLSNVTDGDWGITQDGELW